MTIYFGSNGKFKLHLGNSACCLKLFELPSIVNGIKLLSFDGYQLKDSQGLYLTVSKEDDK